MSESITVRFSLPVPASRIYSAWLDSKEHSAMTGAKATASREVGGEFTAWDGYIRGKNLLLIENKKIVQSWRSSEFPEEASDSVLSIQFIERQGLTEVVLEHSDIPPGQSVQYQSGWIEFYANPMQKYFAAKQQSELKTKQQKNKPQSKATGRVTAKRNAAKKAADRGKSAGAGKKVAKTKAKSGKAQKRRRK